MADEWETVAEESPTLIVYDKVGDSWQGTYLGKRTIEIPDTGETFRQDSFRGDDGELYAVNPGVSLREALDKVAPGTYTRMTYVKDVQLGDSRSAMKSFRVQTRK